MHPEIQVIANGGAKGMIDPALREQFVSTCEARLPGARITFAEEGGDVGEMVRDARARGTKLIVAAGGDGTINAVASELVGTDIVLGVLPLGTLNHFSRDLGIPQELEEALDVIHGGTAGTVDVGVVNNRYFLNNSGLGLYPDMVYNRTQRQKHGLGKWPAVFVESVRAFAHYRLLRLRIRIDGRDLARRTPAVFVGNNEYSLEGTLASKRLTLVDGCLCVYIPHPESRFGLLWYSLRAFFGNPQADGNFDKFITSAFSIHSHHHRLRVSLDGEVVIMQTPLEYCSEPGALRVMLPAAGTAAVNSDESTAESSTPAITTPAPDRTPLPETQRAS